jgi:hypothetical protein
MVALQANWDFLNDFQERGTAALDAFLVQASGSRWGAVSNGRVLGAERIGEMEDKYLPG